MQFSCSRWPSQPPYCGSLVERSTQGQRSHLRTGTYGDCRWPCKSGAIVAREGCIPHRGRYSGGVTGRGARFAGSECTRPLLPHCLSWRTCPETHSRATPRSHSVLPERPAEAGTTSVPVFRVASWRPVVCSVCGGAQAPREVTHGEESVCRE